MPERTDQTGAFRWEPDPEWTGAPIACPECGAACEALRVEPDRSEAYTTHIHLCTREGCRKAWPYYGARALRKIGDAARAKSVKDTWTISCTVAEADRVLSDRTRFVLDDADWDRFSATLDRDPRDIPGLAKLFALPGWWPVWCRGCRRFHRRDQVLF